MNGVGGVDSAHGPDRNEADAGTPPNVYLPVGDPHSTPAYEVFADPATAHGWQNAYDDTVQLDEIVPPTPLPAGNGPAAAAPTGPHGPDPIHEADAVHGSDPIHGSDPVYGADAGYGGGPEGVRAGRWARAVDGRRGTLGRRRARRRGALVAGGIGAAVLVGAVTAGLAGLGTSEKGSPDTPGSVPSATSDGRTAGGDTAAPSSGETSDAGAATSSGDSSPEASTSPTSSATTGEPSRSASPTATTSAPPSTATSDTEAPSSRGNSGGNQGRGQGATKDPK